MHELPWIMIFFVTSEAIRQWFSPVTKSRVKIIAESPHEWKKALFTVTNILFYFLHAISCHEHTNPLRTIIESSFRQCCQGRPFLTEHCDVTTIDLWSHANAKHWYCDVIFVYCHCTRKLVQRRSSQVNNSREYRYLATRYSRLSVQEDDSVAQMAWRSYIDTGVVSKLVLVIGAKLLPKASWLISHWIH